METSILPQPEMRYANGTIGIADQNTLRRLPVQKPESLTNWVFAYAKSQYVNADGVKNQLGFASKTLNMFVEDPKWLEFDNENNHLEFKSRLEEYVHEFGPPKLVLIMLRGERNYN